MNKLRPKIKTPLSNNILNFYEELKTTIKLEDNFLHIEPDFKDFLQNGIANENMTHFLKYPGERFSPSDQMLHMMRYQYIAQYGFSIVSEDLIQELGQQLKGQKVIEAGAGTAFLSHCLQNSGLDILPVDIAPVNSNKYKFKDSYTDITVANAPDFIKEHHFDSVVMSWPNYENSFASDVLKAMKPGQKLYYCGESMGGCTGDDHFFELLKNKTILNENLNRKMKNVSLSWEGIHDQWCVYDIVN